MPVLAFTERALQSLKPLPLTVEYYDSKTSGLALRVLPTGKKTFYMVYRAGAPALASAERRLVRLKLGRYPEVDLAAAREQVRTKRLTPDTDAAPVVLFKDLATDYIERHCKIKKKSWKQDVYWIDAELRPHWGDRPVGEIRRRDVAQLLNRIADPPRHAPASSDHVRAVVSRLFRFGISQGIEQIEYNPATGIERAKPAGKRVRFMDAGEIKRLWRVWEEEFTAKGRPLIGEQFKLRLLTAQRGGEVLNMMWSAIDLDAGLWNKAFAFRKRKPTEVHQHSHLVPLSPMAVAVLRGLKAYHERELARKNAEYGGTWNGKKFGGWPREHISDWVFPSRTNPARAMANFFGKETAVMRTLAKVEDFDPHDLRRTASTWANATCPMPWVERLLDHEIGGVAGTYNLYAYVEQKAYTTRAIENKVREALEMPLIEMPPRPPA
ncbi:MAG: integrase family protein [Acidobacteria bacterium]|nr:integrase family protein [Acidobacteriota bacterium]